MLAWRADYTRHFVECSLDFFKYRPVISNNNSSAEVKNVGAIPPFPHISSWHSV
jgi:hypothetical protein